jgi:valyl-tRNA synthetase
VGSLARAKVRVETTNPGGAAAQVLLSGGVELVVPLAGMIDLEKEKQRLDTEIAQLDKQLTALDARLSNEGFVSKAKPQVVEAERAKAAEWRGRLEQLREKRAAIAE